MQLFQSKILQRNPKIICVGKNYLKHVKEMGGSAVPDQPIIFLKPWSSINYQPTKLSLPIAATHKIDHEVELGVFISKGGSHIKKEDAMAYVGGYFLAIDWTDRDLQTVAKAKGWPWSISKGQDNFCPISSFIPPTVDPYAIQIEIQVNEKVRQSDLTGSMHFKIDDIISYVSEYMTLDEGDLILTGTPEGVAPVQSGDRVLATAKIGENTLACLSFEVTN